MKRNIKLGRVCRGRCKKWQPWENFHKHKTSTNGYNTHCKACRRDISLGRAAPERKHKTLQEQCPDSWDAKRAQDFILGRIQ
jgi:hypothetical protein